MTPPTVLVLGAAGRFGAAAAGLRRRRLARAGAGAPPGRAARPASRPLTRAAGRHRRAGPRAAGASVVVHAVNPIYTRWDAELLPLLRPGPGGGAAAGRALHAAGQRLQLRRSMPALLDEDTPQRPSTRKGRAARGDGSRAAARAARRAGQRGDPRRRLLRRRQRHLARPGDRQSCAGQAGLPRPAGPAHAWAYLPDLARAFVAVAERRRPPRLLRCTSPATR
jgi:hypothetical protein